MIVGLYLNLDLGRVRDHEEPHGERDEDVCATNEPHQQVPFIVPVGKQQGCDLQTEDVPYARACRPQTRNAPTVALMSPITQHCDK